MRPGRHAVERAARAAKRHPARGPVSLAQLAHARLSSGVSPRLELAADRQPGLRAGGARSTSTRSTSRTRLDRRPRTRAPAGRYACTTRASRDAIATSRRAHRPDHFGTFSQSARNFARPMSVSGCFASCSSTESGHVATCAPIRAAWWTCIGCAPTRRAPRSRSRSCRRSRGSRRSAACRRSRCRRGGRRTARCTSRRPSPRAAPASPRSTA